MFTDDLKDLMAAEGVSQSELARRLGVSHPVVNRYLQRDGVTYMTVERILDAMGYRIMWVRKDWEEETLILDVPGKDRLTMEDIDQIKAVAQGLVGQEGGQEELIG